VTRTCLELRESSCDGGCGFTRTAADQRHCRRRYAKLVGANFDLIEHDLRMRLALEQRLTGAAAVPFGLDRMNTTHTAGYLGLKPETLRSTAKRKLLGLPEPYSFGKKLFWRRSELDAWVERQRREPSPHPVGAPS
jgi:hypothetical protein